MLHTDGVVVGGGFALSAVGVIATALTMDIGGTPIAVDGAGPVLVAMGLVGALCGLAYAAVMVARNGVSVTHRMDPATRKAVGQMTATIRRADKVDDDPPASD